LLRQGRAPLYPYAGHGLTRSRVLWHDPPQRLHLPASINGLPVIVALHLFPQRRDGSETNRPRMSNSFTAEVP
jgi:hypothetical protein